MQVVKCKWERVVWSVWSVGSVWSVVCGCIECGMNRRATGRHKEVISNNTTTQQCNLQQILSRNFLIVLLLSFH